MFNFSKLSGDFQHHFLIGDWEIHQIRILKVQMKTRKEKDKTLLCNRTRPRRFFPSPSENLTSPLPGENFNFIRPLCGFPGVTQLYIPSYIIWVCLTKAKHWPDRKGQPGGKFSNPVRFFRKPSDRCHWVCYKEVWQDKPTSLCRQLSESCTGLSSSHRPFVASQHHTKNTLEISGFHVPGIKLKNNSVNKNNKNRDCSILF